MEASGESRIKLANVPVIIKEELVDEITDQDLQTNSGVSFANEVFGKFRVSGENLLTHAIDRPHVCRICGKSYNEKYQLTKHLRTHAGVKPYSCRECGESFSFRTGLKQHMSSHTGIKPFSCDECGKHFSRKNNLKRHSVIHTGEKPYTCDKCQKSFTQTSSLRAHIRLHTGERPYECRMCGKFFAQKSTRNVHIARCRDRAKHVSKDSKQPDLKHSKIHPKGEVVQIPGKILKNSILTCTGATEGQQIAEETFVAVMPNLIDDNEFVDCGKDAMEWSEQILDHNSGDELSSSGEIIGQESYLCRECGEDFTSENALQIHKKIHSDVGHHIFHTAVKSFVCNLCGKNFAQKCNLKRHLITHTDQKPYSCDTCQKRFTQQSTLKAHIRLHTGEKPYECKTCGKFFTQGSTLNVHIARRHSGIKHLLQDSLQPDLKHSEIHPVGGDETVNCAKDAVEQSERLSDPNIKHELTSSGEIVEQESYLCRECGEVFPSNPALQIHKKIHRVVGPFICPECDQRFSLRADLSQHMSSHAGVKPFICDLCGKHFAHKCNLKRHSITHTGQKPYSCGTCQKRFTQQSTLKAHIRLHTGEKPFECKTCGKFFTQSSTLHVHIARRHSVIKHVLDDSLHPGLQHSGFHPKGGEVVQVPDEILKNSIAGATGEVQQNVEETFVTEMTSFTDDDESVNCGKDAMEQSEQISVRNCEDELALAGELVEQESHLCQECGEVFPSNSTLQIHKKIHRVVGPFICPECGQCFSLCADLSQHMTSHAGVKPFVCDLCGKHFAQKCNLKRHAITHTGQKPYSCDTCQKRFTQQSTLKAHIRLHTGEKPYECKTCGKFFTQGSTLNVHIARRHSGPKRDILEEPMELELRRHSGIHPEGAIVHSNKKSPGKILSKIGSDCVGATVVQQIVKEASANNMPNLTGDEESWDCDKDAVEQPESLLHNCKDETVSAGEIVSYAREDYGRHFQRRQDMLEHKQIQASLDMASRLRGAKPYACSNCGKSFTRKADLDRHVRIHTGQKPHKCFECGRSFTQLGTLNSHLRIHTGEKPHLCTTCGRRFVQRTALIVHMRTHNGIRPYVCHECGKGFSVRSALKRHAEIHTDDYIEKNSKVNSV